MFAFDAPGRAHAKIAELGGFVSGVPALHDALEALRPFVLTIAPEPFGLDQAAAQGSRGLLILAGKDEQAVVACRDLTGPKPFRLLVPISPGCPEAVSPRGQTRCWWI